MNSSNTTLVGSVIVILLCALAVILCCVIQSCTVSMTMNHSEGGTTSLDEDQTTSPDVHPDVSVPVSLTGK